LTCAYRLAEKGSGPPVICTLIEAEPRLGGKILTEEVDGFVVEEGPESFLAQKPWGLDLCRRLGLNDRLIGTNPARRKTFVYSRGRLRELPEGLVMGLPTKWTPFIRSGILSWPGKLRVAAELVIPPRGSRDDESLGGFFRRRLGKEALERMVDPLLSGIYAGDPEELSLLATFPRFRDMEQENGSLLRSLIAGWWRQGSEDKPSDWTPFVTLQGGLSELVKALEARLKNVSILTGRRVRDVRVRSENRGYEVALDDGGVISADAVAMATPAYDAASLIEPFDQVLAGMLRAIPYSSTVTVSLGYRRAGFGHDLDGYGFVVPRIEGRSLLASTWTSSKWMYRAPDGAVLIRSYLGGVGRENILDRTDEELVALVRSELRDMMNVTEEPVLMKVCRWPRAMPQYRVGHLERLTEMEDLLAPHPGLFLTGAAYRGVGIPDCIREGALTAEKVLRYFNQREEGQI
jgi:oxygen-dependent protoporphyrinogen oxidase